MKKSSFGAMVLALCLTAPSIMLIGCRENIPTESPNLSITESVDSSLDSSFEEMESSLSSSSSSDSSSSSSNRPSQESTPPTAPPEESSSSKEEAEVAPSPPKPEMAGYIKCTGDNVNIRSGAGTSFSVLGSAEKGTVYAVTGKFGNWYQTYYRGKTAYVYTEYAAVFSIPLSGNDEAEKVISEGYKHIGVPYVYGAVRLHDGKGNFLKGFTAQKFDCSSLVQYVYYQAAGKLLDVTTRTQFKQGKFVSGNDLQRGDCIYFTNESRQHLTGIERVGHVAIYLGNNYILHTASDYARIEKMSQQRWDFYLEARRFV